MARRIYGKIKVEGVERTGAKLRVMAWDADFDDDDHMGTAPVAEDGSYSIEYTGDAWDWSPPQPATSWRPDIYIVAEWLDPLTNAWKPVGKSKVYSNQETRDDREINLNVSILVVNACTIRGSVTDLDGNPLEGYTVTAWDEDPFAVSRALREVAEAPPAAGEREPFEFLGSAVTNENGEYRIQYAPELYETLPRWSMRGEPVPWWRPDIFIKVHKKEGPGVVYRSPTNQNVINITGVRIDAKIEEA